MTSTSIEEKIAAHDEAIARLLADHTATPEHALPRPPAPSLLSKDLWARQEAARRQRAAEMEAQRIEREAVFAADAPRRAKVEKDIDGIDLQVAKLQERIAPTLRDIEALKAKRVELGRTL